MKLNDSDSTTASNAINKLWEINPQLKEKAYQEMVNNFADTFVTAEDIFNEKEITKALIEVIQEQRYFHKAKENFYSNLLTTIKFEINDI